ncbi:MAG: molybdopterin molybdotransferase MoeA [Candidatus Aminicenantes bacterium]|nr:molybdopterin molybdotransferase MoeA [Candidatus Aminicenantes bacterium]
MIQVEDAEKILNKIEIKPAIEEVPLLEALGRVLAGDVVSKIDMPPFDKSAMDGFAFSSSDKSPAYKIVETIAAGDIPQKELKKGECAKIMTGAMLPKGADRVIKREITAEEDGFMTILEEEKTLNVCHKGEDVKTGDLILSSGALIRPQETAIIASMGRAAVPVYKKPLVGILTTGSEIVEPGGELRQGQIYNSNAYSLTAQVRHMGAAVEYGGIALDDKTGIKEQVSRFFEKVDMVIISGGVSMGDFDFVPGILEELGVKLYFQKIAIKPGKPTVFGTKDETVFFGLPGNPVSTFVVFEIFVKPFLYRMMGFSYEPFFIEAMMKQDYKRKKSARTAFLPVMYRDGFVETVEYHGSAHLYALSQANALLKVPAGQDRVLKGSTVYVRQV